MPSKSQSLRPRMCALEKGDNGYGFHLHGEKGKTGQFIRLVEPDSPAESSGLRAGDRLVFVNGEDVETESHQQVVSRIRATVGRLELIVVDPDTEQLLKKHGMKCMKAYVTEGVPLPVDEEEEEEVMVEEEEEKRNEEEEVVEEVEEDAQVDGTVIENERRKEEEVEEKVLEEDEVEEVEEEEEEVVEEEVEEERPRVEVVVQGEAHQVEMEEEEAHQVEMLQEEAHQEEVEVQEETTQVEVQEETPRVEVVVQEEETPRVEVVVQEEETPRVEVVVQEETPRQSTPVPEVNGDIHRHVETKLSINSEKDVSNELRPRLCVIQRGPNGYGFNLHSERARPGQYIRAVDEDSPAERAGLQPKDRIVQVNNVAVEGKTHSEVVGFIKAGGVETQLLVVDPETDAFFKRCRVAPNTSHLTGPLPEPVINGGMEEKVNGRVAKEAERDSKLSISPSPSNASSNTSLTTPPANTPPEGLITDAIPALNMSLQQVKELAHQKRSNKRAPPMDWTKKNELFSNL